MTSGAALAAVAGAGTGIGVFLVIIGFRPGSASRPHRARVNRGQLRRLGAGAAAGLAVLAVTHWIAVAAGVGVLVVTYDRLFGGTRRMRGAQDRLDALAGWTESLRDLVASGIALPEALPAAATGAAPAIREQLNGLVERLAAREPVETALRALADDLDDGGADLIIAALILNVRAQGRSLEAVLTALAASTRAELRARRGIDAERRSTRRAVQVVVTVTVTSALGLALGNPAYVAPYRTAVGQGVLVIVVAVFGAGFVWLAHLAAVPATRRLLAKGDGFTKTEAEIVWNLSAGGR
jgi:Flp pilus assembly protein TadB